MVYRFFKKICKSLCVFVNTLPSATRDLSLIVKDTHVAREEALSAVADEEHQERWPGSALLRPGGCFCTLTASAAPRPGTLAVDSSDAVISRVDRGQVLVFRVARRHSLTQEFLQI